MFTKLFAFIVNVLLKRFDGLKTYLGIAGTAVSFLVEQALPWLTQTLPSVAAHIPVVLLHGLEGVFALLAALGYAHKQDKATAAAAAAANAAIAAGPIVPAPMPVTLPAATARITANMTSPLTNH